MGLQGAPRGGECSRRPSPPAQPHFPSGPGRLPWQRGHNCSPRFPQPPAEGLGRSAGRALGASRACWGQRGSARQTLGDPKSDPKRGSEGALRHPDTYTGQRGEPGSTRERRGQGGGAWRGSRVGRGGDDEEDWPPGQSPCRPGLGALSPGDSWTSPPCPSQARPSSLSSATYRPGGPGPSAHGAG